MSRLRSSPARRQNCTTAGPPRPRSEVADPTHRRPVPNLDLSREPPRPTPYALRPTPELKERRPAPRKTLRGEARAPIYTRRTVSHAATEGRLSHCKANLRTSNRKTKPKKAVELPVSRGERVFGRRGAQGRRAPLRLCRGRHCRTFRLWAARGSGPFRVRCAGVRARVQGASAVPRGPTNGRTGKDVLRGRRAPALRPGEGPHLRSVARPSPKGRKTLGTPSWGGPRGAGPGSVGGRVWGARSTRRGVEGLSTLGCLGPPSRRRRLTVRGLRRRRPPVGRPRYSATLATPRPAAPVAHGRSGGRERVRRALRLSFATHYPTRRTGRGNRPSALYPPSPTPRTLRGFS